MSKIYQSLTELVGNTPLLEIKNIEAHLGLKARLQYEQSESKKKQEQKAPQHKKQNMEL